MSLGIQSQASIRIGVGSKPSAVHRFRRLIWGPSGRLLAEDKEIQAEVAKLQAAGVEVLVCKACADKLGVSNKLAALGLKVM